MIGNDLYDENRLVNAGRDADAVAAALRQLGFEDYSGKGPVTALHDASKATIEGAAIALAERVRPGDVIFFFYAGHGIQIEGENYLVPVNYAGRSPDAMRWGGVAVNMLQAEWTRPRAVPILVLDACRNNPFEGTRGIGGRGLANAEAPIGSLIAYATRAGQTASDNSEAGHGLFTTYLIEAMTQPGITVKALFDRVRGDVYRASRGRQFPAVSDELIGDVPLRAGDATGTGSKDASPQSSAPAPAASASIPEHFTPTAPEPELIREAFGVRVTFSRCSPTVNKTLSCQFTLEALSEATDIMLLTSVNPTGMHQETITYGTDMMQRRRNVLRFRLSGNRTGPSLTAHVIPEARPLPGSIELEGVGSGDDRLPELHLGVGLASANRAETLILKAIPIRNAQHE